MSLILAKLAFRGTGLPPSPHSTDPLGPALPDSLLDTFEEVAAVVESLSTKSDVTAVDPTCKVAMVGYMREFST